MRDGTFWVKWAFSTNIAFFILFLQLTSKSFLLAKGCGKLIAKFVQSASEIFFKGLSTQAWQIGGHAGQLIRWRREEKGKYKKLTPLDWCFLLSWILLLLKAGQQTKSGSKMLSWTGLFTYATTYWRKDILPAMMMRTSVWGWRRLVSLKILLLFLGSKARSFPITSLRSIWATWCSKIVNTV